VAAQALAEMKMLNFLNILRKTVRMFKIEVYQEFDENVDQVEYLDAISAF
jgi:hypothetical protein